MDPDYNLAEQLRLAQEIIEMEKNVDDPGILADNLAALVIALDEWIRKGGFLPKAWTR